MAVVLPDPEAPSSTAAKPRVKAYRHWKTGQTYAAKDQWPLAVLEFDQALKLNAIEPYALAFIHGLIKAGRSALAVQRAEPLRRTFADSLLLHTLESHAWLALNQPRQALQCLQALPDNVPRDYDFWVSIALSYQRCSLHNEAIQSFMQALGRKMDAAVVHFRMGMSFKDLGMKAEAAECVRTALTLGLGSSELAALAQMVFFEREACRWPQAAQELARLREKIQALPEGQSAETGPFPHAVFVDDPLEQLKVARHYALHVAAKHPRLPPPKRKVASARVRLGYLSSDFHNHATTLLMVEMLEHHNRDRFEITLFSTGPDDATPMRQRVIDAVEHFEELRGASFEEAALRVRQRHIDILVDLKGITYDAPFPVLAYRPAPIQVNWLGFPGSSGAPFIDYFIGDPVVSPLEHEAFFSEKIAQMPVCYQPNDSTRFFPNEPDRQRWGVPQDALLLCAFHQSYKISPQVFDVWCQILHACPAARLWLLHWNQNVHQRLIEEAQLRGIGPDRLIFAPLVGVTDHLSRLACADLYLDAWPCTAHTTASEALWVGVPVLTIIGQNFAHRVAASLLRGVGLDELIFTDVMSYQAKALQLINDPDQRQALKNQLIEQRHHSPVFNGQRFAHDIEDLYLRMWERHQQGQPPAHLPARSAL